MNDLTIVKKLISSKQTLKTVVSKNFERQSDVNQTLTLINNLIELRSKLLSLLEINKYDWIHQKRVLKVIVHKVNNYSLCFVKETTKKILVIKLSMRWFIMIYDQSWKLDSQLYQCG